MIRTIPQNRPFSSSYRRPIGHAVANCKIRRQSSDHHGGYASKDFPRILPPYEAGAEGAPSARPLCQRSRAGRVTADRSPRPGCDRRDSSWPSRRRPHTRISSDQTVDGDHGRIETRTTTVIHDVAWLQERHTTAGPACVQG